jgi:uncharacterized protein (TIGR02246 family)
MNHAYRAAAMLAAMLIIAAPGAASAQADAGREARDRAQIAQLMWNYARALDSWNAEAYAQVFTPDGAFGATKGREALRKMVVDLKKSGEERAKGQPQGAMHHVMTNEHIEFTGPDRARVHYYWMTVFAGATQGQAPRVAAVGRGVDDVVRVDGKWLIQSRDVAPKD